MKIKLNKNYVKLVLPYILVTTTIYSSRYLITDKLPLIRNKEEINTKDVLILGEKPNQGSYYETPDNKPNQVRLYTKCTPHNNKYKLQGYLYTFNKYNEEELQIALENQDEAHIKEILGPPKEIEREVSEEIKTPYIEGIIFKDSNTPTLIKESLPETILNNTFLIATSIVASKLINEVAYIIKERKEYKKTPKN